MNSLMWLILRQGYTSFWSISQVLVPDLVKLVSYRYREDAAAMFPNLSLHSIQREAGGWGWKTNKISPEQLFHLPPVATSSFSFSEVVDRVKGDWEKGGWRKEKWGGRKERGGERREGEGERRKGGRRREKGSPCPPPLLSLFNHSFLFIYL